MPEPAAFGAGTAAPLALGEALEPGRLLLIAGPCIIENESMALTIGASLAETARRHGARLVFKASYRKANRSGVSSFTGPGDAEGLRALERVRRETGLPTLTDVHEVAEVEAAAAVCDCLQIPAFLSRQTALLQAAAASGRAVNVKKGQFLAPDDMGRVVEKLRAARPDAEVWVTERGATFGYHDLVVDMRSLATMRALPGTAAASRPLVVFDVTHSLQHPGSGGDRRFALPLARAALAAGADALFFETHPDPRRALSDATTQLPLAAVDAFVEQMADWKRMASRWLERPDAVLAAMAEMERASKTGGAHEAGRS